ncbi:sugar ABC transporter ATP-binding protein [Amycolatopsis pithecellobii]|uniref:ATP-binding cassette domain-containing protein n=1 Tax=Amycolatopsis pithecellobii TaxID=664692 RepID=A0A6N7Z2M0_9PSEU|nr:sugar ABC transporter ATP-binding protein [Amycolatopsis pithecellobii]MTD54291.1 ATP-binding cassette domain-containing protein [Amycolatopsis pithecellobii]
MTGLQLEGIVKSFSGVRALRGVSLDVPAGEVRALLGENGSGKSTLIRIVAGEVAQDSGLVSANQVPLRPRDIRGRQLAGVGIVGQSPEICAGMSVADNMFLAQRRRSSLRGMQTRRVVDRAQRLLDEWGLGLDARTRVGNLSQDRQHLVEVARVIAQESRIIAFDETTASLTEDHVEHLFAVIRRLRDRGSAILFVTHRLAEVFDICDSVTVLRDGEHIQTAPLDEFDTDRIVQLMVGRSIRDQFFRPAAQQGPVVLSAEGVINREDGEPFKLDVRAGEVVGIAGLVGSGRSNLLESLYGLRPRHGLVACEGRRIRTRNPADAMRAGVGLVPEDRRRQGLALSQSLRQNASLLDPTRRGLARLTSGARSDRHLQVMTARIRLKAPNSRFAASTLSGGNQQKIVLGRLLEAVPRVLLLDEPTRGIDVGAKREIYDLIHELAEQGTAIVLVASELPELLGLSDRIIALRSGRVVEEFPRGSDAVDIGRAIIGTAPSRQGAARDDKP